MKNEAKFPQIRNQTQPGIWQGASFMSARLALSNRCGHITQKVRIDGQRTLYIGIHDDKHSAEIFLRLKGPDCSSELIGLYDVVARLMSIALQYGAPA